jgi:hypothetical protein
MAVETIRDVVIKLRIDQIPAKLSPPDATPYRSAVGLATQFAEARFESVRAAAEQSMAAVGSAARQVSAGGQSLQIHTQFVPPDLGPVEAAKSTARQAITIPARFDSPDLAGLESAKRLGASATEIQTRFAPPDLAPVETAKAAARAPVTIPALFSVPDTSKLQAAREAITRQSSPAVDAKLGTIDTRTLDALRARLQGSPLIVPVSLGAPDLSKLQAARDAIAGQLSAGSLGVKLTADTSAIDAVISKLQGSPIVVAVRFDLQNQAEVESVLANLGRPYVITTQIAPPDPTAAAAALEVIQHAAEGATGATDKLRQALDAIQAEKFSLPDQLDLKFSLPDQMGLKPEANTARPTASPPPAAPPQPAANPGQSAPAPKPEDLDKVAKAGIRVGDSLKNAGEGAFTLARGIAFLSADSEKELQQIIKNVAMVQGAFDIFKGGFEVTKGLTESLMHLKEATGAASSAEAIATAIKTTLTKTTTAQTAAAAAETAATAANSTSKAALAATAAAATAGETALAAAETAGVAGATAAAAGSAAVAAGNVAVATTAGAAATAMIALRVAMGPIGLLTLGIGAAVSAGIVAWARWGAAAEESGDAAIREVQMVDRALQEFRSRQLAQRLGVSAEFDDLTKHSIAARQDLASYKINANTQAQVGALGAMRQQVEAARQLDTIDERRARAQKELTAERRPDETREQMLQRQIVAQGELIKLDEAREAVIVQQNEATKKQLEDLDKRREAAQHRATVQTAGGINRTDEEFAATRQAAQEELVRIEQERLAVLDKQAETLREQQRAQQGMIDLAKQALEAENRRVASNEEKLGRLNPAQQAEAKRLSDKVARGEELTPAELNRAEQLVPGAQDYVSQQYQRRGQQAFGGQGTNALSPILGGPQTGAGSEQARRQAEVNRLVQQQQETGNAADAVDTLIDVIKQQQEQSRRQTQAIMGAMVDLGQTQQTVSRQEIVRMVRQEIAANNQRQRAMRGE